MLVKLKKKGTTLIISEHRISYLMDIVDRVFFIEDGEIQREYKISDFKKLSVEELNASGLRDKSKIEIKVAENPGKGNFEIKNIEFNFKGTKKKLSLKNMIFETSKIYGIIGTNGLGKSTFLRCLIGVEKSSKEEIYLDGSRLSKKDRLKLSSLVMQDVNHQLFTDSVIDEVGIGIKISKKIRRRIS